jgi:aminotransferase EvaB
MSDQAARLSRSSQPPVAEPAAIPLNDLRRHTDLMRAEIDEAVAAVLTSGRFVLGPNVSAFETEFATYCGVRHCVAVANGTDALELGLRALGCGAGREVITVANAGMYATAAIVAMGATPVLVDIDPETMTMAPEALARAIGATTAAVIVTHLYGRLADLNSMMNITGRYGVPLIEDCAQAHGAERGERKAGTVGAIGCFSFYPTKNLGALGDGGALTTNDDQLSEAIRRLRQYGWRAKYDAVQAYGRNSRLDELQAAVLRLKLPKLDAWNARRRSIIGRYRQAASSGCSVLDASGADHAAHLCIVRCANRQALRELLTARHIATDIHYPIPDHRQEAMRHIFRADMTLPHTERAAAEVLTLPCFPEMTEAEIVRVCDALAAYRGS